jgi:hypothetical protein
VTQAVTSTEDRWLIFKSIGLLTVLNAFFLANGISEVVLTYTFQFGSLADINENIRELMSKLKLIGEINFIPSFAVIILFLHALFLLWKNSAEVLSKKKVIALILSIAIY